MAAGMTLIFLWFLWPFALLGRLIFALLAVPFALLLFDTARLAHRDTAPRPGLRSLSLAALSAIGLSCCAYLIVTAPGQHPRVETLTYLGALAAGGAAVTRIGQEAVGAGRNERGPNEALQADQRENHGSHRG